MTEYTSRRPPMYLRTVATTMALSAILAAPLARAWPTAKQIVVPPVALPEPAREPGQAMLLHDSDDGRTLLYVEQGQGARLAILDVTNPARIRSIGTVSLDAAGTFDFVASLGNRAELIRFRDGRQEAVLDLSNVNAPALRAAESPLARSSWRDAHGYQLAGPAGLETLSAPVDAAQVRDRVTNDDTGTSFLLTDAGIYVIRRPNVERDKERLEDERR